MEGGKNPLTLATPPQGITDLRLGGKPVHHPQFAEDVQEVAVAVEARMPPRLDPEIATRGEGRAVEAAADPRLGLQHQGGHPAARRVMGQPQATDPAADDDMLVTFAHGLYSGSCSRRRR